MKWVATCWKFKYAVVGIVLVLISFVLRDALDVAIGETYYVVANWHVSVLFGLIFFLFEGIRAVLGRLNKPLNKSLMTIHWIGTVLSLLIILISLYFISNNAQRYTSSDYSVLDHFDALEEKLDVNEIITFAVVLFVVSQFILLWNIITTIFRKKIAK